MKIRFPIRSVAALRRSSRALLVLAVLAGCVSVPPAPAPWGGLPPRPVVLGVQYATSTGGAGFETAEVFIANPGPSAVVFTNAVLDGVVISGGGDVSAARQVARRFRPAVGGLNLPPLPPRTGDPRVVWSQFYPAPEIRPGGAALFQVGFRAWACHAGAFRLVLHAADGTCLETTIPRCAPPRRRILSVAWSADGAVLNVQCDRGAPPSAVSVNGVSVGAFRVLESAGKGRPSVVSARLPAPVQTGGDVLLELGFGADGVRRAFLRALPGIVLDAPDGRMDSRPLPAAVRRRYGFDDRQVALRLPFDVACDDTRAGRYGDNAPDVAAARLRAFRRDPARLYGVDFCTALYPAIWNIYAPVGDVAFVKPYQLHWGPDPARFIENEDARVAAAVAAVAPRPVIWVPERFKRARHLEGPELEVLAWTALLRGVKGVRCHFWMNNPVAPFADCPGLGEMFSALDRGIAGLRPVLSPLIPMGTSEDRPRMTLTYEGWAGDAGVLLLVRNMRYSTDGAADDAGRRPRFRVSAATDVAVAFVPPPWLRRMGTPVDPLTGASYAASRAPDGRLSVVLPRLEAFRLVWIPNADPAALLSLR